MGYNLGIYIVGDFTGFHSIDGSGFREIGIVWFDRGPSRFGSFVQSDSCYGFRTSNIQIMVLIQPVQRINTGRFAESQRATQ